MRNTKPHRYFISVAVTRQEREKMIREAQRNGFPSIATFVRKRVLGHTVGPGMRTHRVRTITAPRVTPTPAKQRVRS